MKERFQTWWSNLNEREQLLSLLSAVFILLAVIYWGAWKPLANSLQESELQLQRAQQTLGWVQKNAALLVAAGHKHQAAGTRENLTQIVTKSARQHDITFSRIVNKQQQLEVWITEVEFDLFIKWLTSLSNQYSVSVINADFSKVDKQGYIKINRLLLGY